MAKEFSIGLPLHQIPKAEDFRKFILPPTGMVFITADCNSQETHLMMELSEDQKLLEIYQQGLDPHAMTAAAIGRCQYKAIIEGFKAGDMKSKRLRMAGKVKNLSGNFRCGYQKTHQQAHVQWGMTDVSLEEVKQWDIAWRNLYKGIPIYWNKAIARARYCGYAETLAGRRFYISRWDTDKWASESSAIMMPIQGTGADMKYLAITYVRKLLSILVFWGDVHDEIIYVCPYRLAEELGVTLKHILDNLPYKTAWGWEPKVPFTWTVSIGDSWGNVRERLL